MKSARPTLGASANRAHYSAIRSADLYKLPAQSLRPDPLSDAQLRERAALSFVVVFLSLLFAIPMVCVGIILHFR